MNIPAAQLSSVRIANMNQQCWQELAEAARPWPNQLESAGVTRRSSSLCLSQWNVDQQRCRTKKSCKARYASLRHCLLNPIYTPSKYHMSATGLASARESVLGKLHVSLYQLTSLCQSARVQESGKKSLGPGGTCLYSQHVGEGASRVAGQSTEQVPGQPELHRETLSQGKKRFKDLSKSIGELCSS